MTTSECIINTGGDNVFQCVHKVARFHLIGGVGDRRSIRLGSCEDMILSSVRYDRA